jgi:hypothetical protein
VHAELQLGYFCTAMTTKYAETIRHHFTGLTCTHPHCYYNFQWLNEELNEKITVVATLSVTAVLYACGGGGGGGDTPTPVDGATNPFTAMVGT